jgi:hypothetical protein
MNNLVYEIPESLLTIDSSDIVFMESLKEKYKDLTHNVIMRKNNYKMTSGYHQYYIEHGTEEERSNTLFAKIAAIFPNTTNSTAEAVANNAQLARINGHLNIHLDYRSAVLSIPLVDLKKPIRYWSSKDSDGEIIFQYHYTKYKPVLINTHVEHNVIENDEDRIFLQIGGFKAENGETFENLRNGL